MLPFSSWVFSSRIVKDFYSRISYTLRIASSSIKFRLNIGTRRQITRHSYFDTLLWFTDLFLNVVSISSLNNKPTIAFSINVYSAFEIGTYNWPNGRCNFDVGLAGCKRNEDTSFYKNIFFFCETYSSLARSSFLSALSLLFSSLPHPYYPLSFPLLHSPFSFCRGRSLDKFLCFTSVKTKYVVLTSHIVDFVEPWENCESLKWIEIGIKNRTGSR